MKTTFEKTAEKVGRIAQENRLKILAAAELEFSTNGFKGARVQDIANRAGLPKTNVLYYYQSKKRLYTALLHDILTLWNSRFDMATCDDEPAEVLANYIADKMKISRSRPAASKIFALEIINGAPNLSSEFRQQHAIWIAGRVKVIEQWITKGKLRPMDPSYLLYNIWASTQHYADFSTQINGLQGREMNKQDFDRATLHLVEIILTGCGLRVPNRFVEI